MISVIIPTRNRCEFLSKCVESILSQERVDFEYEIIVVDNASKDSTKTIVEEFVDKREEMQYNSSINKQRRF